MAKKVIIIDDSALQLNILKTVFEQDGWQISLSMDANSAYEAICKEIPAIIITDAIMPLVGGFQLVKKIRKNPELKHIPIIIYSVLPESNAKYYIKKENKEYFLSKNNSPEDLLEYANNIYDNSYLQEKDSILPKNINKRISTKNTDIKEVQNIGNNEFIQELKQKVNISASDEKNVINIFEILYKILHYDLALIKLYDYDNEENVLYYDIKDILISPIFQAQINKEFNSFKNIFYKKYSPNLKAVSSYNDFLSKKEYEFKNLNCFIGKVSFYATKEHCFSDLEINQEIYEVLNSIFKIRYVNKNVSSKKNNIAEKYLNDCIELKMSCDFNNFYKDSTYVVVFELSNKAELEEYLTLEEMDTLKIKIGEKIKNYLISSEKLFKNEYGQYVAILFEEDKTQLEKRLECIVKSVNEIKFEDCKPAISIGVSNCNIQGNFDIIEAQKIARNVLEKIAEDEKTKN